MFSQLSDRKAVLVFAREIGSDLRQRGWGRSFQRLLQIPRFLSEVDADVHIFTTRQGSERCRNRFPEAEIHLQTGGSFGESLEDAVENLSGSGYRRIVVIGRDCPELTREDVETALRQLQDKDLVLGPDHRGGLYLIGLKGSACCLINGIHWQEDSDFAELASRAPAEAVFVLPVHHDLDTIEDVCSLSRGKTALARLAARLLETVSLRDCVLLPPLFGPQRTREVLLWQLPPPSRFSTRI